MNLQDLEKKSGEIEKKLQYSFKNQELLLEAFVHKSFFNENRKRIQVFNERLEFLGDSVLNLIVTKYLFVQLPQKKEGKLSFFRSRIVDAFSCSEFLKKLQLEEYVLLGKGEAEDTRGRTSIFADLFEAVLGAIYLDGGFLQAKNFFLKHFEKEILSIIEKPVCNYKAELQNYCQKKYQKIPTYYVVKEEGLDHSKTFEIEACVCGQILGRGVGFSKKNAEKMAAKEALRKILQEIS